MSRQVVSTMFLSLVDELRGLFAESGRLQAEILGDLEALGKTTTN